MPKTTKDTKKDTSSRSWFAVLNNPQESIGKDLTPEETIQKAQNIWINGHEDDRSCGINYEVSDSGTPHLHMVLEGKQKIRFSAVKKLYPGAHLEETQGSKKDAEDYLYKRGAYAEKNHTLVAGPIIYGEITAKPRGGEVKSSKAMKKAEIFEMAEIMIENGATPREIFDKGLQFLQYKKIIKEAYFQKRYRETPIFREVKVYFHFGPAGTGKTRTFVDLCEKYGEDHVFLLNDYNNASTSGGGFDSYNGEEILFMDEYRGQFPYQNLLNILDGYRGESHARYANVIMLWNEVHITTVYPPEKIYDLSVDKENQDHDSMEQLMRRIDQIIYHYLDGEEYKSYAVPTKEYQNVDHMMIKLFKEQPPDHLALTEYGDIVPKEAYEAWQKKQQKIAEKQKQADLETKKYMEQIGFYELEGDNNE